MGNAQLFDEVTLQGVDKILNEVTLPGGGEIFDEVTPLGERDTLYVVDSTTDSFTFPLHRHAEFEINFAEACSCSRRIVGDSAEVVGDFDLFIVGHGLEHQRTQHNCPSRKIREVTIQFPADIFGNEMLRRNRMQPIKSLLERAAHGVAFPEASILRIYHLIDELLNAPSGFNQMLKLIELLQVMAIDPDARTLSSDTSRRVTGQSVGNDKLRMAQDYIAAHFREEIRLSDLTALADMSPSSFSRFFKQHTGRSLSDYIIGLRLDAAAHELVGSDTPIAKICVNSGFNNLSNFNRIFKKNKGCTPKEFREIYKLNKFLI